MPHKRKNSLASFPEADLSDSSTPPKKISASLPPTVLVGPSADDLRRARVESQLSPHQRAIALKMTEKIVPMSRKEAATLAGLPPDIVSRVKRITNNPSFMEFLDILGASKEFVASALFADILAKPGDRLAELKLLADIHGIVKPQVSSTQLTIDNSLTLIRNVIEGKQGEPLDILPSPQDADLLPAPDEDEESLDHLPLSEDDDDDES